MTGPATPKVYGKAGRLSNPQSGLTLLKIKYLDDCVVQDDETNETFEVPIKVSQITQASFKKGIIEFQGDHMLQPGSIVIKSN